METPIRLFRSWKRRRSSGRSDNLSQSIWSVLAEALGCSDSRWHAARSAKRNPQNTIRSSLSATATKRDTMVRRHPRQARERPRNGAPNGPPLRFHGTQRGVFPDLGRQSVAVRLLTLGIYSARGEVRLKRYLCSHTELDGSAFEFRTTPLAILRGRAMALALLGGFALSGVLLPIMRLEFTIVLLRVLTPWIVVAASRSLRMLRDPHLRACSSTARGRRPRRCEWRSTVTGAATL